MSYSRGKRKAEQTESSDEREASSLSSPNLTRKHPRLSHFPPHNVTSARRYKLQFEYGSNISFKVLQSAVVLHSNYQYRIDEQVANVAHAQSVLEEAQKIVKDHDDEIVAHKHVALLKSILDKIKSDSELKQDVRARLLDVQHEPHGTLNNLVLDAWHDEAIAFMEHMKALAKDFDMEQELRTAREVVQSIYHACTEIVGRNNLIVKPKPKQSAATATPSGIRALHQILGAMGQKEQSCQESTRLRFEAIYLAYQMLADLVNDNKFDQSTTFGLTDFADALGTVANELKALLGCYGLEKSLNLQYSSELDLVEILCQGCCHALVSISATGIHDKLTDMLRNLREVVSNASDMTLEGDFRSLASIASAFTMTTPATIDNEEWVKYAPRLLSRTQTRIFMNKLQYLYAEFQDKVYHLEEIPRLWLTVWRGLKVMYLVIRESRFKYELSDLPVEQEFFQRVTVRNQFELVLSGPEPLHSKIVENIVAEYCILITECQTRTALVYGQFKKLKATSVLPSVTEKISTFVRTQEWDNIAIRGVEKSALRLNHLLGGPAFVRRSKHPNFGYSISSAPGWTAEKIGSETKQELPVTGSLQPRRPATDSTQAQTLVSAPAPVPVTSAPVTSAPTALSATSPIKRTSVNPFDSSISDLQAADSEGRHDKHDNLDTQLHHTYAVSAFDYVVYPFPETRALEVAQSRQIERELYQPGIESRGAHEEDVINRPPRHTWPPGSISVWAKLLPVDPLSVLHEFWSTWRHGQPTARPLTKAKPYPLITPRRPRREWADEHPRLRPLRDVKNRVTKPASRNNHHHDRDHARRHSHANIQVPKLRGGRGGPASNANPESNGDTGTVQALGHNRLLSTQEMNNRTQQLMSRLRGWWRGGDLPPYKLIQDHFLVPTKWIVDTAHADLRLFVNTGRSTTPTPITHDPPNHDNEGQPQANQSSNLFQHLGVNPGSGLHPQTYGLPISRGDAVSNASDSFQAGQDRGRMLSRQVRHLDPILEAHRRLPAAAAARPTVGAGRANFDTTGLPPDFPILEESFDRLTPVPSSGNQHVPAGNQEHQRRIERRRTGMPSQDPDGSSSDQEICPPTPTIQVPRTPDIRRGPALLTAPPVCRANFCHPCPQYTGLFHHICRAQAPTATNNNVQTHNPPNTLTQISRVSSAPGAPQSTSSTVNPRPPRANAAPQQLIDLSSATVPGTQNGTQPGSSRNFNSRNNNIRDNRSPQDQTATETAGHNLRDRIRLAQQQQDREARVDALETNLATPSTRQSHAASTTAHDGNRTRQITVTSNQIASNNGPGAGTGADADASSGPPETDISAPDDTTNDANGASSDEESESEGSSNDSEDDVSDYEAPQAARGRRRAGRPSSSSPVNTRTRAQNARSSARNTPAPGAPTETPISTRDASSPSQATSTRGQGNTQTRAGTTFSSHRTQTTPAPPNTPASQGSATRGRGGAAGRRSGGNGRRATNNRGK